MYVFKANDTITTRNSLSIMNLSFGGNIEELGMLKVFLVILLVAIMTLLNFSPTDNEWTGEITLT